MASSMTDQFLANNKQYAKGQAVHQSAHPGKQPIQPSKRVAVVACMDARLDVEDLLGIQTGDAHIIRNAGGVVTEDAIRCLIISHHLLNTNEIILIHHTRCGMLAFTDDLLKAGLEGDPAAEKLLGQATNRPFMSCGKCASFTVPVSCLSRGDRAAGRATRREERGAAAVGCQARDVEHSESPLASCQWSRRRHGTRLRL